MACRTVAGALASVLAPADCRVCGGILLEAGPVAVCASCLNAASAEEGVCCDRCSERLPLDEVAGAGFSRATPLCETCVADPPDFVRAYSFGPYTGTLRALIRLHKFEGMQEAASPLGTRLAAVLRRVAAEAPDSPLYVVAVPLFRSRRRYNQSEQMAEAALRELRRSGEVTGFVAAHGVLRRVRATESQSHLTPAQRRDNVRGAFAVSGEVAGRTIVLVDDVYTTGATAAECTRTLRKAGASAVYVATVARAQPDRAERWSGDL